MKLFRKYFEQKAAEKLKQEAERLKQEYECKQQQAQQMIKDIACLVWCYDEVKKVQRRFDGEIIELDQKQQEHSALFKMADVHYQQPDILRQLICEVAYHQPDYVTRFEHYQQKNSN